MLPVPRCSPAPRPSAGCTPERCAAVLHRHRACGRSCSGRPDIGLSRAGLVPAGSWKRSLRWQLRTAREQSVRAPSSDCERSRRRAVATLRLRRCALPCRAVESGLTSSAPIEPARRLDASDKAQQDSQTAPVRESMAARHERGEGADSNPSRLVDIPQCVRLAFLRKSATSVAGSTIDRPPSPIHPDTRRSPARSAP